MAQLGNLYVIAAPSGTGKTTLVKALVDAIPKLTVSISHTTRPKRHNETHGINYYFVSEAEFNEMIAHHDFLEYATIFDNLYGTSKKWVEKTLQQGIDVILEIDWQGHQQIKKLFPHAIGVFVLPPSLEILQQRLIKRNQDNSAIIAKRLADTKRAVSHLPDFDYVVVNDQFDLALKDLSMVIQAGRLLRTAQIAKIAPLIQELSQ